MTASTQNPAPSHPVALVARMAAGNERALAALYDAYGHVAYALALAITRAQPSAERVVSQAFAEAWRSASSFDGGRNSVLAWLTAIVRKTALRTKAAGDREGSAAVNVVTAGTSEIWEKRQGPVGDAVRALSSEQRQVIELSYYRGLTVGEIAAKLGEPESGARELLRSAMHELRAALGPNASAAFDERVVTRA